MKRQGIIMSRTQSFNLEPFSPKMSCTLVSLNYENRASVLQLMLQVNNASNVRLNADKTLQDYAGDMTDAALELNSAKVRHAKQQYLNQGSKLISQNSVKKFSTLLSLKDTWAKFYGGIKSENNRLEIAAIQTEWKKIQAFAQCSVSVLLYLANRIVPELEDYIHLAWSDLRKHPDGLLFFDRERFIQYLNELKKTVVQIKKCLVDTMLAKLHVCPGFDAFIDYNLVYIKSKRLHDLAGLSGGLSEENHRPSEISILDVTALHRYVEKEGDEIQKRDLGSIKWLRSEHGFVRCVVKGKYFVVPKALERYALPKRWWDRLANAVSPDRDFIPHIFSNKVILMLQLKALGTQKPTLNTTVLSECSDFQYLEMVSKQLAVEIKEVDQQRRRGVSQYIFRQRNAILDSWKQSLRESQEKIVIHKISLLQQAANNLETRISLCIKDEADAYASVMKELLSNVDSDLKQLGAHFIDQEVLKGFKHSLEEYLQVEDLRVENDIDTKLREIGKNGGRLQGSGYLAILYSYINNIIPLKDSDRRVRFKKRCQAATQLVLQQVMRAMQPLIQEAKFPEKEGWDNIVRALLFIHTFGLERERQDLKKLLLDLQFTYCSLGKQEGNLQSHSVFFDKVESLFNDFGDEALQKYSLSMKQLRTMQNDEGEAIETAFERVCGEQHRMIVNEREQADVHHQFLQLRQRLQITLKEKVGYTEDQSRPLLELLQRLCGRNQKSVESEDITPVIDGLFHPGKRGYSLKPLIDAYLNAAAAIKSQDGNQVRCAYQTLDLMEPKLSSRIFTASPETWLIRLIHGPDGVGHDQNGETLSSDKVRRIER